MGKHSDQMADFVAAGFRRLDENLTPANPPKIHWGKLYMSWGDEKKVQHLEKLAATMNHAAALIQDERNKMNDLLIAKEAQLNAMKKSLDQTSAMVAQQIAQHNEEKQQANRAYAALNAEVRELRKQQPVN